MNRRSFIKQVTGFVAGVVAVFVPKAKGEDDYFWIETKTKAKGLSAEDICNMALEKIEGEDAYYYGWMHCWLDNWDGVIVCHSCSTKDCSVRDYATKVTNYPEHNIHDKLVAPCGWPFLYGKWTKQQLRNRNQRIDNVIINACCGVKQK